MMLSLTLNKIQLNLIFVLCRYKSISVQCTAFSLFHCITLGLSGHHPVCVRAHMLVFGRLKQSTEFHEILYERLTLVERELH
jgi:hypothetical protein